MTALRILLVSRRFWPLTGNSEDAMADLAVGLKRHGAEPTVLTARWTASWPATTYYQGIPVHGVPLRADRPWGRLSYLLSLTRWLERHREFDLVVVARLRREACATLWSLRAQPIPVVLRAAADDCMWQSKSPLGARCRNRCRRAAAVICPDQTTRQTVRDAGYCESIVHLIPDGIPPLVPARGGARLDARLALAAVNQDLNAAVDAPVAVYVGRLRPEAGLACLVRAWERVVRRWPTGKLWLIGEGPFRDDLHQLIRDLDLKHCVLMPGTFESTDELLRAANVLVYPGSLFGIPRLLLVAAGAGVPVVATAGREIQDELDAAAALASLVTLVPRGDAVALAERLIQCLQSPIEPQRLVSQGREVLREHSLGRMTQKHLDLFRELIDARVTR
ncbi:MAG: glycosyltransferase family 4 protein [Planctomycetes bacterium]|nr:glycosyltransferase family 4 protein [Planctomycetota bacterium]